MRFTKEQADFLKKELGVIVEPDQQISMSKDEWYAIQDKVFLIEGDEARPDGYLNERCRIAVRICDMRYED